MAIEPAGKGNDRSNQSAKVWRGRDLLNKEQSQTLVCRQLPPRVWLLAACLAWKNCVIELAWLWIGYVYMKTLTWSLLGVHPVTL